MVEEIEKTTSLCCTFSLGVRQIWNNPFVLEENNNHGCEIEILHAVEVENVNSEEETVFDHDID